MQYIFSFRHRYETEENKICCILILHCTIRVNQDVPTEVNEDKTDL